MDDTTDLISGQEIDNTPTKKPYSPTLRRFKAATTALMAITRMTKNKAKTVQNLEQLYESVQNSPTFPGKHNRRRSQTIDAIDMHRNTQLLFQFIRSGSRKDMLKIGQLIQSSPSQYLRERSDPESFINKKNSQGLRPLHEAVRNGHLDVVILLMDYGADPKLKNDVDSLDSETLLVTASRWNFIAIVDCLLRKTDWNNKTIKQAFIATKNQGIKLKLKEYAPSAFNWWRCCFCS